MTYGYTFFIGGMFTLWAIFTYTTYSDKKTAEAKLKADADLRKEETVYEKLPNMHERVYNHEDEPEIIKPSMKLPTS